MRAVVQRVISARLETVDDEGVSTTQAEIGRGLVALVGIEAGDTGADGEWMARKITNLRIFRDGTGRMNGSLLDEAAGGGTAGLLLVPNFTVAGRARRGRRPDFTSAMAPGGASAMFERLAETIRAGAPAVHVETGVFGAHMHVGLVNDGPVTIWLDSRG